MNLWFRLLYFLASVRWRPAITLPHGKSILQMRVWPLDLDISAHMNNGRYLTLMDLGRVDIMVASGLWRAILRHRWTPIASAVKIRYRRELTLFQRFRLVSRIVAWEDEYVVIEQVFVIASGPRADQVAARALFRGGLYDRAANAFVPISRLMAEIGIDEPSPKLTPEVVAFLEADAALKETDKMS